MKRKLTHLFVLALVLALVFAFASCGENTNTDSNLDNHEHDWMMVPSLEPTCTQDGYTASKVCVICGEFEIKQEIIPARHTEETIPAIAPTCKAGLTEGKKCSICEEILVEQEEIAPKLPHTYTDSNRCDVCSYVSRKDLMYSLDETTDTYCVTSLDTYEGADVVIPSTYNGKPVSSIGDSAFWDKKSLTSITIPDSVISIGNYAFYHCEGLTSITIPNSVISIGDNAFQNCKSLTNIVIPNSVISIGNDAFKYCTSLTNVKLSDSIKIIPDNIFYECKSLTSIGMPSDVTSIGIFSFSGCSSLTSIVIPISVKDINWCAFVKCDSLTIYCEASSPLSALEGSWDTSDCLTYYYSENEPAIEGYYWHYVNGEVVVWE